MKHKRNYLLFLGFVALLFAACKKDKMDMKVDNRLVPQNRTNSNVRIINLSSFNQVIANGDSLTNFVVQNPRGPDYYKYPATSYFPGDGRLGKTWNVPQDLFDKNEKINFHIATRVYLGSGVNEDITFQAVNSYQNPTDYYLLPTFFMTGQPEVVPVPRDVTAPKKADHFKIRIVNLSGQLKSLANGPTGAQENLSGPVSLAFADGTLVDAKTSNITTAAKFSEYVEVPYGTYQFKVLMADGRQVPSQSKSFPESAIIDPPTSTMPVDYKGITNLTFAPIQTYQPGGVYTIVITPQKFEYISNELGETVTMYQNSFQVLSDISAAANQTYYRVQGANAFNNQPIGFRVNGNEIAKSIDFGKASGYSTFVHGQAKIEAIDASGKVLAEANQLLRPAQNYTLWLHPEANGNPKLLVLSNDLSGTQSLPVEEDGTYGRTEINFFNFDRYLNLSVGNPYITFTADNGQALSTAKINLQPGIPIFEQPYIRANLMLPSYQIMAYRSTPTVVPGIWAKDIEVLSSEQFIANKELYLKAGRKLPTQEAGVFTVALIGKTGSNVNANEKARIVIIKHNK
ncbi:DUF4397 domain-containing protein [Sphingobacterium sp. Mn56C]|uniref:DUF4397 domain-containing protein n=1 Tax=Sphingobacterium sp. Mn56C TaxID=3395261 RepID=UPI003BC56C4B